MSFKFACPHCGQRIGANEEDVGTVGGCPSCLRKFTVPASANAGPKTEAVPATVRAVAAKVAVAATARPAAVASVTKRGLSILALLLSILPGLNLIALGLAIFAVIRSDRPGRRGERGLAVAAVTVASLLVIPMDLLLPLVAFQFMAFKRPPPIPAKVSAPPTPSTAAKTANH
jgi:hypothetical protein